MYFDALISVFPMHLYLLLYCTLHMISSTLDLSILINKVFLYKESFAALYLLLVCVHNCLHREFFFNPLKPGYLFSKLTPCGSSWLREHPLCRIKQDTQTFPDSPSPPRFTDPGREKKEKPPILHLYKISYFPLSQK